MKILEMVIKEFVLWGGLIAMAVGLWWERPSVALIVIGGLLFFGSVRNK